MKIQGDKILKALMGVGHNKYTVTISSNCSYLLSVNIKKVERHNVNSSLSSINCDSLLV